VRKYGKSTKCIQTRVGEHFVLELSALATAGFTWLLNRESALAVLTQERIRPGGPGIGASSIQEFEFTAVRAGAGALVLEYKRPWEKATKERLELELEVKP